MFCRHCGSEIADGTKFCPNCGLQTDAPDQSPAGTTQAPAGQAPAGQAPVNPTPAPQPIPRQKASKNIKIGPIVVSTSTILTVLVTCVVLIGILCAYGTNSQSGTSTTSQTTSGTTLEDVLRESGTLDEFIEELKEEAVTVSNESDMATFSIKKVGVSIAGNKITLTFTSNMASTDSGSAKLVTAFKQELSDTTGIQEDASTIKSLEEQSGIEGIQLYRVLQCSDGVTFGSALIDNTGLIDSYVASTK